MSQPTTRTVFGREHEKAGSVYFDIWDDSKIAFGTSPGVSAKPNEDALGVAVLDVEMVLAIADGHWGREASELAVSKAVSLLRPDSRPSKDSETRARLFALYEQINTDLFQQATSAPGASTPETTLIVCHVKEAASGRYLYWSSFGDSYLFLLRKRELIQLNSLNPFWLGYLSKLSENANTKSILMRFLAEEARYVGVASGLETGIEKLEQGDVIFLCTDGLVGSDYEPEPAILAELGQVLHADGCLKTKVEAMIGAALRRGERDNISCVLARI